MERNRLAVGRDLPALGEYADRLAVAVEIDQDLLDLAADDVDASRSLQAGIELPLLGTVMHFEDAALTRRFLCEGAHWIDDIGCDRRRGQERGAAADFIARQIHHSLPRTARP